MKGGELLRELLYYGVSSISLSTTGSEQEGVRACTSRMREELYPVMEERMKAFHEDHPEAIDERLTQIKSIYYDLEIKIKNV